MRFAVGRVLLTREPGAIGGGFAGNRMALTGKTRFRPTPGYDGPKVLPVELNLIISAVLAVRPEIDVEMSDGISLDFPIGAQNPSCFFDALNGEQLILLTYLQ